MKRLLVKIREAKARTRRDLGAMTPRERLAYDILNGVNAGTWGFVAVAPLFYSLRVLALIAIPLLIAGLGSQYVMNRLRRQATARWVVAS